MLGKQRSRTERCRTNAPWQSGGYRNHPGSGMLPREGLQESPARIRASFAAHEATSLRLICGLYCTAEVQKRGWIWDGSEDSS